MRILTWNINGLRSVVTRFGTLRALLQSLKADIICFQEIKIRRIEIERELAVVDGWESFFTFSPSKAGPGYSGVATFCRTATASTPVAVEQGLTGSHLPARTSPGAVSGTQPNGVSSSPNDSSSNSGSTASSLPLLLCEELGLDLQQLQALDSESRALITDHGAFVLVNLYGPALTSEERIEERLSFKLRFYQVLEWRIRHWTAAGRQVIVVGDLNISPAPIDSCDPHPITQFVQRPDRVWLNKLLGPEGPRVVDIFRHFHPNRTQAYTCWNTATGARQNNYGTRIDHILAAGMITRCTTDSCITASDTRLEAEEAAGPGAALPLAAVPVQIAASGSAGALQAADTAADNTPAAAPATSSINILIACDIMAHFEGSDHAPVWVDVAIPVQLLPCGNAKILPGSGSSMFTGRQASLKGWLQKQQTQQEPTVQQRPLQQQQQNLQQGNGLQQHSSSSSGKTLGAAGKRKQAGLPQPSSSKRPAGQGSMLSFVRQPPASSGDIGSQKAATGMMDGGPAAAAVSAPGAAAGVCQTDMQGPCIHPLGQQSQGSAATMQSFRVGDSQQQPLSTAHQQQQQQLPGCQQQVVAASAGDDPAYVQQALDNRQRQAKVAWQQISRAMQPPLCRVHREVCVIRTVKKKGANFGRQFYVCARADGPPPVGRCDYFEWAGGEKKLKGSK